MDDRPLRVLVDDDDEDDYVITRELLSQIAGQRFDLDREASYEAALETMGRRRHDVYLLDYRLGEHDGLQLLKEAIAGGCKAPIILLTGQGDRRVDVEAMKAGATDYLVKGQIDAAVLERSIRYAVERKRLEEQLLQAQKMEAVGQLAGGVAHDFNNLLSAILGYAQLGMVRVPPEGDVGGYLRDIQKAAERAGHLTRQLLAFSRRQVVEPTVVDLNDLIANMEKMLRRLIGEHIELSTVPSAGLGLVKVDSGQVEQVLVNLAVNARDAMPEGGRLNIETANLTIDEGYATGQVEATPGHYVVLSVIDTGIGMSQEVQARIFEPFFSTKEPGRGSGLGLSTCYGLVKKNGGHIAVLSAPGKGSNFKIYLPRAEAAVTPISSPTSADHLPIGRETLLLVEDEQAVRDVASEVLREQGYTVLEVSNGVEALDVASRYLEGHIDLLLTDVVMPLMGGAALAKHMRERSPDTRVLYTSGYIGDTVVRRGELEDTELLNKPFTPTALAHRAREVLDAVPSGAGA